MIVKMNEEKFNKNLQRIAEHWVVMMMVVGLHLAPTPHA